MPIIRQPAVGVSIAIVEAPALEARTSVPAVTNVPRVHPKTRAARGRLVLAGIEAEVVTRVQGNELQASLRRAEVTLGGRIGGVDQYS